MSERWIVRRDSQNKLSHANTHSILEPNHQAIVITSTSVSFWCWTYTYTYRCCVSDTYSSSQSHAEAEHSKRLRHGENSSSNSSTSSSLYLRKQVCTCRHAHFRVFVSARACMWISCFCMFRCTLSHIYTSMPTWNHNISYKSHPKLPSYSTIPPTFQYARSFRSHRSGYGPSRAQTPFKSSATRVLNRRNTPRR